MDLIRKEIAQAGAVSPALRAEITRRGDRIVPLLAGLVHSAGTTTTTEFCLIQAIGQMSGRASEEFLIGLVSADPNHRSFGHAADWLTARAKLRPLSLAEEEVLLGVFDDRNRYERPVVARVLALAGSRRAFEPIKVALARSIMAYRDQDTSKVGYSGLTAGAGEIMSYVRAVTAYGAAGEEALEQMMAQATDAHTRTWLTIALGMCRVQRVEPELVEIAYNHADPSTRCQAMTAYAEVEGNAAVPWLRDVMSSNLRSGNRRPGQRHDRSPAYTVSECAIRLLEQLGSPITIQDLK
jgi:hypothetical protein